MVAHNCHDKSINLTAKRITSPMRQKEKDSRQKEKLHGKKKNLTAKRKTQSKKKTTRQKEQDSRQNFFDTERTSSILISFAMRSWLFFLPWGYSICRELLLFAVRLILLPWQLWATVPLKFREILFPKILDFATCGYSRELAWTLLIWLAFKP